MQLGGENGHLQSSGFPSPYPENLAECWLIITRQGTRVELDLFNFSSEPNKDILTVFYIFKKKYVLLFYHICFLVKIYDGGSTSATLLRTISGQQTPGPIFTSDSVNSMLLVFTSDDAASGHPGFEANYLAYGSDPDSGQCHSISIFFIITFLIKAILCVDEGRMHSFGRSSGTFAIQKLSAPVSRKSATVLDHRDARQYKSRTGFTKL